MGVYDYSILEQLTRIANSMEKISENLDYMKKAEELLDAIPTSKPYDHSDKEGKEK